MKKRLMLFFIVINLFFIVPLNIFATETGKVNDPIGVNIRKTPSTNGEVIAAISYDKTITIINRDKYTGTGCSDGWYKVNYNAQEGYVCSAYITLQAANPNNNAIYYTYDFTAKVNTSGYIRTRNGPSYNDAYASTVNKLISGTNVTILEFIPGATLSCNKGWYKISYHNSIIAYACADYISKKEELTLLQSDYTGEEEAFSNALKAKGFPDNYLPYLMRLHRSYPLWNFEPIPTGLYWDNVVNGEANKNKIGIAYTDYLSVYAASLDDSSEKGWVSSKTATDAYFLDPKNFLSENFVFMFQDMRYDSIKDPDNEETRNKVKAIFPNGSYMREEQYITDLMDAAKTYGVSPYNLAARITKEGGSKETYGPVNGFSGAVYNGCLLNGFYNYYNLWATTSWMRGLYYAAGTSCPGTDATNAYGRAWTSRRAAILGGAWYLKDRYVYADQYSMYLQKFNLASSTPYTNQYMTNLMAPSEEAEYYYKSLKENEVLSSSYSFSIPVFLYTPDVVSLPSIANTNNQLNSIIIDGTPLNNFDSDVIEYNKYVVQATTSVTIGATPKVDTSNISGLGTYTLTGDTTTFNIVVTAESGDTKTYKVNIIKVNEVTTIDEIIQKLSVTITNDYISNIKINTPSNGLINSILSNSPNSIATVKDANGNVISANTNFKTGQTLTINSTSNETRTFKIAVTGDVTGDGEITILDLLRVQKHLLGASVISDIYRVAADTNSDNTVTILDLLRIQKHILREINL